MIKNSTKFLGMVTIGKIEETTVYLLFSLFIQFLSYFFVKKYLLVGASSMLWTGQRVSESVRDVCMSHQSDRIYYKQPVKFLVLKANGI